MNSAQHHRGVQKRAHVQKSIRKPVWTGKRDATIDGSHKEISWHLSRKSENDTKTFNRDVSSSVLDLNLTIPNTKPSLISTKSHIVWGAVCESFYVSTRGPKMKWEKRYCACLCLNAICFFPSVYAIFVIVELFVCFVTCEKIGR
jgi:hypothetical protein